MRSWINFKKEGIFMRLTEKSWYKWLVAAGCFLMIFLGLGFCSSNKSLYLGAITKALEIPRSMFALQDTLRFTITAISNVFFGVLVAKLGPKLMTAIGFMGYIGYLAISMYAEHIVLFYLAGCLLGLGTSFCATAMVSYLVSMWFPEKRGTVSGAILCANGLGGAIAAQIISPMIESDVFGYRKAYGFALMIALITGVIVVLTVTKPKGVEGKVAKKKAKGKQWLGISFQEALKKPYFYAAAACVFLTGMSLQGIHGIAATHMKDAGVEASFVATVLSVSSILLAFSKFVAGFSYDKLGLRKTLAFCEICGCISFLCLAMCNGGLLGKWLAMGYGIFGPLSLPLETVIVPLIAADLFGEQAFSRLMGIFVACNYAGYAVGGFACNLVFDLTSSYVPVLIFMGVLMLTIAVTFQFIISAANKVQKKILAEQTAE